MSAGAEIGDDSREESVWSNKPKPRTYTESEVREMVAKAYERVAEKYSLYSPPREFIKWLSQKAADIRSGKEDL